MNTIGNSLFMMRLALFASILVLGCNNERSKDENKTDTTSVTTEKFVETNWNVKARLPNDDILDVKAIDKDGQIHDIKAIQKSDQTSLLDIKAFVNGKILPVKILLNDGYRLSVKAIDNDGTILDIKAITDDGQHFDIKGVTQSGNIIHIKAIDPNGDFYGIEAISPKGWINDVKGIKMFDSPVEATINGVEIFAHIKSITKVD